MTPEAAIIAALYGRVEAIPGGLPILYGTTDEPQPAEYIQVNHMPNTSDRIALGDGEPVQRQGVLQVTLAATLGQNEIVYVERAGSIAAHFRDQRLTADERTVTIDKVDVGQGRADAERWRVPVSVYYRCYA